MIGVTENTIWLWEHNRIQARTRYIPAIHRFLGYCPFEPGLSWADRLKMCRVALGMSQEAFALAIGVDESTVRNWEAGVSRPIRTSREKVKTFL